MKNRLVTLVVVAMAAGWFLHMGCGSSDLTEVAPLPPTAEDTTKYWVSASEGSDSNLGTIRSPFATIGKGVAEAIAGGGVDSVFVVAGTYHETVTVGDAVGYFGIQLLGGYGPYDVASASRPRDLVANVTQVDRIVIDGSAGAPINGAEALVEGFLIGSVASHDASPAIKDNVIRTDPAACSGRAALLLASSKSVVSAPVISDSVIDNVGCLGSISEAVGVELASSGSSQLKPQLRSVQVTGGSGVSAATHSMGILGKAVETSSIELGLESSAIATGTAVDYAAAVNLFADTASAAASIVALSNDLRVGTAAQGFALDLGFDSIADLNTSFTMADLQRNKIFGGTNCIFSAGVSIANATSFSSIVNNFISGGTSTQLLAFEEGIRLDIADADIRNNTVVAETGDTAYMIDLVSQTPATKIENNILFVSTSNPGGVLAGVLEALDVSPASVKNNLFDDSLGIVYSSSFGGFGDLLNVGDLVVSYPAFVDNLQGAALLVDPANLDLHISAGSAAIDAGNSGTPEAVDFDGQTRPMGVSIDIGADELM